MKTANLRNFIPLLYCLDDSSLVDINSFDGYNELQGCKD